MKRTITVICAKLLMTLFGWLLMVVSKYDIEWSGYDCRYVFGSYRRDVGDLLKRVIFIEMLDEHLKLASEERTKKLLAILQTEAKLDDRFTQG